jgi:hypothetical protein
MARYGEKFQEATGVTNHIINSEGFILTTVIIETSW